MNVWLKSFIIALIIAPIVFFAGLKGSAKMVATSILYLACSVAIDIMYPHRNDETEQS